MANRIPLPKFLAMSTVASTGLKCASLVFPPRTATFAARDDRGADGGWTDGSENVDGVASDAP